LYVDVLWLVTCVCLDSFWAAVVHFYALRAPVLLSIVIVLLNVSLNK